MDFICCIKCLRILKFDTGTSHLSCVANSLENFALGCVGFYLNQLALSEVVQ